MRKISRCLLHAAAVTLLLACGLVGCDDDETEVTYDASDPAGPDAMVAPQVDGAPPGACQQGVVPCEDDILLDLSLHDDKISEGTVQNVQEGADWVSTVDATAGGVGMSGENPFIYLKFDTAGLTKVAIDDDDALSSEDWDIAARRFIIRLNGGSSGSGCVGAVPVAGSAYTDVATVPDGTVFLADDFYTDACVMVDDSSGLPGSPAVTLATWWSYDGCVKTTDTPFLIELTDGRVLKFVIEAYYESGQETCNLSGSPGTTSAMYTWRWSLLN